MEVNTVMICLRLWRESPCAPAPLWLTGEASSCFCKKAFNLDDGADPPLPLLFLWKRFQAWTSMGELTHDLRLQCVFSGIIYCENLNILGRKPCFIDPVTVYLTNVFQSLVRCVNQQNWKAEEGATATLINMLMLEGLKLQSDIIVGSLLEETSY